MIDLNDFDEAHPGGWEWDLRRLVASIWVAGRENGRSEQQCARRGRLVRARRTGTRSRSWPTQPLLMRSYNRLDVDRLHETATEKTLRAEIERSAKRARHRTSDRALPRFTREHHGRRQIVEEPPLITHVMRAEEDAIAAGAGRLPARRWPRTGGGCVGGYTILDVAHKVVGVGSVGLRAYVVLLEGSSPDDVLFLQLKQARRSVLAPYVHGESAWHAHQGQRVVEYQQALQTVSDPLLGWTTVGELAVLRPPVPQHEGHHPPGRDRRGGADRLRRHRRAPAGQGPRPDQRRVDDRRLLRPGRTTSSRRCAGSPRRTPTRPRPTTPPSWPPLGPAGCRSRKAPWTGPVRPSAPDARPREWSGLLGPPQVGQPDADQRAQPERPRPRRSPAPGSAGRRWSRPLRPVRGPGQGLARAARATRGGDEADRLPLHSVVVSRSLADLPSPWMTPLAKITQVEPTSGVSPQPAESAGRDDHLVGVDGALVDPAHVEAQLGGPFAADPGLRRPWSRCRGTPRRPARRRAWVEIPRQEQASAPASG